MKILDTSNDENMQLDLNSSNYNDLLTNMNNFDVEDLCQKFEKDTRRYKRYLGNDSRVVLV